MRWIYSPVWLGRFNTMAEARAAFRALGQPIAQELRFPHVDPSLVRFMNPDRTVSGVADVRELLVAGAPSREGSAPLDR